MLPERYTANNSSNISLTQTSIPELNLIPSIARKKDPPNHPIYDWKSIFAITPIYELTESHMRKRL